MLEVAVRALIHEEQQRQNGALVRGISVDRYLDKLFARAETVCHASANRCNGFIAFYCNDRATRDAYVSLLVVAPEARGTGLAASLLSVVKSVARSREFARILLTVHKDNEAALRFYSRYGFHVSEDRPIELLLECDVTEEV